VWYEVAALVATVIIAIVAIFFGKEWAAFRKKLKLLIEVLVELDEAIEDEEVTREEVHGIIHKATRLVKDP